MALWRHDNGLILTAASNANSWADVTNDVARLWQAGDMENTGFLYLLDQLRERGVVLMYVWCCLFSGLRLVLESFVATMHSLVLATISSG